MESLLGAVGKMRMDTPQKEVFTRPNPEEMNDLSLHKLEVDDFNHSDGIVVAVPTMPVAVQEPKDSTPEFEAEERHYPSGSDGLSGCLLGTAGEVGLDVPKEEVFTRSNPEEKDDFPPPKIEGDDCDCAEGTVVTDLAVPVVVEEPKVVKDSTPEFEAEEKRLLEEEQKLSDSKVGQHTQSDSIGVEVQRTEAQVRSE
jgi:hypothetical protein